MVLVVFVCAEQGRAKHVLMYFTHVSCVLFFFLTIGFEKDKSLASTHVVDVMNEVRVNKGKEMGIEDRGSTWEGCL